jgi:anti-sigma factor RsiW
MTENICTYSGRRDELLVSYLYDEIGREERSAFERHLLACALCRTELAGLRGVRSELAQWAPAPLAGHIDVEAPPVPRRQNRVVTRLRDVPAWAQFAAAMLCIAAAASIANIEVTYTSAGVSVQTGWRHPASGAAVRTSPDAAQSAAPAPWRDELLALERDLRSAINARQVESPRTTAVDDVPIRQVRQLIQESERRQQNELALRVAEVARDMQTQRQADLVKIDRTLAVMQSRTGMEVMRTQRQVNSLAQQVSQRP